MPDCNRSENGSVSWKVGTPLSRFGRGRWFDVFDHLLGLDDVGDHQVQAVALLDDGKDWLLGIAFFPRDSQVGIVEVVFVSAGLNAAMLPSTEGGTLR